MSKVILFNRPIWVVKDEDAYADSRSMMEIYGYKISYDIPDESDIKIYNEDEEGYLNYLCGVSRWQQEGNIVGYDIWTSVKTGLKFFVYEPLIQDFMEESREQMGISYKQYETDKPLNPGSAGVYCKFIVSRSLYEDIKKNGKLIKPGEWERNKSSRHKNKKHRM